ncbi:ribonuclease H-like domain-containing protein [Streptomyces sp. MUSC 125]|uniref:ribonuclease H-like domain-containing protein n=1 Tax=Streptomyces sp. MUSC 125 TaxID=1428624 RepID=UPI0008FCBA2D|nr:ribonuclease H-like domain-containing protein [Streptomyces sp. MUSC 125]
MPAQKSIHESRIGRVKVFRQDLPRRLYAQIVEGGRVAWDIETNGLDPQSSQIGTCQIFAPRVGAFVVTNVSDVAPSVLARLLTDKRVLKVFHHAPFDLSFMSSAWDVEPRNVACTKIAAKLINPSAPVEHFSLKYLMAHHFGFRMDKSVRFTDWLAESLSESQLEYAAGDVVRLLDLYDLLRDEINQMGLDDLYDRCVAFLPSHVQLLLRGCPDPFKY